MMKSSVTFTLKCLGLCLLANALLAPGAVAASPALYSISSGQFDQVVRDFSADSAYTSVSPASSLGSIFGFELGLIAGVSNSPNLNSIAQQANSGASASLLPNAALFGALTIPFGLTLEALYFPAVSISGVTYQQLGGAVKWTFTDGIVVLPFSMAVRGFFTTTETSFSQTVSNSFTAGLPVTTSVDLTDALYGLQLLASKDLLFAEPYVGIGYMRANATATTSGGNPLAPVFSPAFTTASSATSTLASSEFLLGLNFKLALVRLGAEYARLYDTDRYSLKLSLAF